MSTSSSDSRALDITVVVGNPKGRSRTWDAAHRLAEGLGASASTSIDLVDLGAGLLGWGAPAVTEAVRRVAASDVVVVASPTYKATYTGVLKLFLDQFPGSTGLQGVLGTAAELHLKPVLVELGATVPAPALYLIDSVPAPDPVEQAWLDRWGPVVRASIGVPA
jgi:FMN reductase